MEILEIPAIICFIFSVYFLTYRSYPSRALIQLFRLVSLFGILFPTIYLLKILELL